MTKANSIPKNSRRYFVQNLFVLTRTFFRSLFGSQDDDSLEINTARKTTLLVFLPLLVIILPILDLFLLLFLPGLHLFKPLFKAGWKYGLISAIGVTLAVSIITQYVFFIYSYQFQAFDIYLAEEPRTYIQAEMDQIRVAGYHQYNQLESISEHAVNFINMSHRILQTDIFFTRSTFIQTIDPTNNGTILPNMPLYGTEGKIRTFLSSHIAEGRAPENSHEVLALMTRDFYNHSEVRVNTTIPVYIPIALSKLPSLAEPGAQTTVNVTGIVFLDEIPKYHVLLSDRGIDIEILLEMDTSAAIVSWWVRASEILHDISITDGICSFHIDLFYDVNQIDSFELQTEIDLIKLIGVELKDWYLSAAYVTVSINSYLINLLESFQSEYNLYQTFMFAFLFPIIALTIILTVYAANLVRKKRDRQLTILTERGTNRREIGSYLALESLIVGGISLIFGVILGIPISALLTKSSGFLMFTNTAVPLQLELTSVSIAIIGSISAILLIQLFNTITLLKKRNIEDYGKVEKSLPTYYKYFVDFIVIGLAIIIWVIYKLPVLSGFQDQTAKYIGIPATVLLLFGLILFVQRLLPWFSRGLVRITSYFKLDIPSLSIREIHRYQKSFVRSSIILTLSFSLVVSSIVVPSTYQEYNVHGAYYDLGADIVIRDFPLDNEYLKTSIENLTEVSLISPVKYVDLRDVSGDLGFTYSVLVIEPESFQQTAYFRNDFSDESLATMFGALNDSLDVLGQNDELNVLDWGINEEIQITYLAYNETWRQTLGSPYANVNVTVTIKETYDYWPLLVNEINVDTVRAMYFHLVARADFMDRVQPHPLDVISYLYINIKDEYAIADASEKIRSIAEGIVTDVESLIFVKPESPRSSILYSAINSTLLMSFAINAIILALFAAIQLIDKSKEIATMKAMGISSKQLIIYYLSVYIALLVFSSILGLIIGYVTSSMLLGVLTTNRTIPPYYLSFPIGRIAIAIAALLGAAIVGATIPTISSSKQEIGTELRQSA
ncbi:MAG: ABC transporter permease [Candidatus Heimdallarchaeota archaeon]|nr:ABC transporter permease [Candidatus Heimdallarchaeota archaeon]MCK4954526.1 ABC transporter permease [Candidatus Heimdallarchaeota archaeon]